MSAAAAIERTRPGSVASAFTPASGGNTAVFEYYRFKVPVGGRSVQLLPESHALPRTNAKRPSDWYTALEDMMLDIFGLDRLVAGGNPAQFLEMLSGERYKIVTAEHPETVMQRARLADREAILAGSKDTVIDGLVPEHAYVVLGAEDGPTGPWIGVADPTHGTQTRLSLEDFIASFSTLAVPKQLTLSRPPPAPPSWGHDAVDRFERNG